MSSVSPGLLPLLPPGRALRGADILAFNHALAAIATAGLPLEEGLRLAAADARSARIRRSIELLVADLEAGLPLHAAFDRHRAAFPPIYSRILQAAIATGNLPAMLLSLGRHQITLDRMRQQISRALFYPMVLVVALALLATLLGSYVLPQMARIYPLFTDKAIYNNFSRWRGPAVTLTLPASTQYVMAISPYIPLIALSLVAAILCLPVLMVVFRVLRLEPVLADRVVIRLPLIGPAIKQSALTRYTDILAISVRAGLDLPAALRLAGDTVGYPRLRSDSAGLASTLETGSPLSHYTPRLIPQTTLAALSLNVPGASLSDTLSLIALLHQQQAEVRASRVPIVLLPVALLLLAGLTALLMAAVVAPLTTALRTILG